MRLSAYLLEMISLEISMHKTMWDLFWLKISKRKKMFIHVVLQDHNAKIHAWPFKACNNKRQRFCSQSRTMPRIAIICVWYLQTSPTQTKKKCSMLKPNHLVEQPNNDHSCFATMKLHRAVIAFEKCRGSQIFMRSSRAPFSTCQSSWSLGIIWIVWWFSLRFKWIWYNRNSSVSFAVGCAFV